MYENLYMPMTPQQMQQMQQLQQMQQMQYMQQQRPQSNITVAQVPTIDHVEQVQMVPGERKIVLVQNNPDCFAIRVADNAGFVTTEYRMSQPFDPKSQAQQVQYAPMQAVMELKNEIEQLKGMIGGVGHEPDAVNAVRKQPNAE